MSEVNRRTKILEHIPSLKAVFDYEAAATTDQQRGIVLACLEEVDKFLDVAPPQIVEAATAANYKDFSELTKEELVIVALTAYMEVGNYRAQFLSIIQKASKAMGAQFATGMVKDGTFVATTAEGTNLHGTATTPGVEGGSNPETGSPLQ